MPPETIRTLLFGTALVLLRSAPPLVTDQRPWTYWPDDRMLKAERVDVESKLHRRQRRTEDWEESRRPRGTINHALRIAPEPVIRGWMSALGSPGIDEIR